MNTISNQECLFRKIFTIKVSQNFCTESFDLCSQQLKYTFFLILKKLFLLLLAEQVNISSKSKKVSWTARNGKGLLAWTSLGVGLSSTSLLISCERSLWRTAIWGRMFQNFLQHLCCDKTQVELWYCENLWPTSNFGGTFQSQFGDFAQTLLPPPDFDWPLLHEMNIWNICNDLKYLKWNIWNEYVNRIGTWTQWCLMIHV